MLVSPDDGALQRGVSRRVDAAKKEKKRLKSGVLYKNWYSKTGMVSFGDLGDDHCSGEQEAAINLRVQVVFAAKELIFVEGVVSDFGDPGG